MYHKRGWGVIRGGGGGLITKTDFQMGGLLEGGGVNRAFMVRIVKMHLL